MSSATDERYLDTLIAPIRTCATYRPRMGQGADAGLSLAEFQELYRTDPFYAWYGLDHPLMYAAHKAAGAITSVYRQIGVGVERLFRHILQDQLGLSAEDARWSYQREGAGGEVQIRSLDGRIEFAAVLDPLKRTRVRDWGPLPPLTWASSRPLRRPFEAPSSR